MTTNNDGGPERIWIESDGECPYFYLEEELSDVASPITQYVRADKLQAEIEALRVEVVEKVLDRMRRGPYQLWLSDLISNQISVKRMREILTFAFTEAMKK